MPLIFSILTLIFMIITFIAYRVRVNSYEGNLVLTKEQFRVFKTEATKPGIHINHIMILDSEEPIVVRFKVEVPQNSNFPFGSYDEIATYSATFFMGSIALVFLSLTIIGILVE